MNQRDNANEPYRAKMGASMGVLLLLCMTLSGCALMTETNRVFWLARRTTQIEPRFYAYTRSDRVDQREARLLAEQAWGEYVSPAAEGYTPDFENGFVEGFADFLYRGGTGEAPAIPPRGYWNLRFLNPTGKAKTKEWYDGFRAGAQDCKSRGLRDMWIVPTSFFANEDDADDGLPDSSDFWDDEEEAIIAPEDDSPKLERLHREESPPVPSMIGTDDFDWDQYLNDEDDAGDDDDSSDDSSDTDSPNTGSANDAPGAGNQLDFGDFGGLEVDDDLPGELPPMNDDPVPADDGDDDDPFNLNNDPDDLLDAVDDVLDGNIEDLEVPLSIRSVSPATRIAASTRSGDRVRRASAELDLHDGSRKRTTKGKTKGSGKRQMTKSQARARSAEKARSQPNPMRQQVRQPQQVRQSQANTEPLRLVLDSGSGKNTRSRSVQSNSVQSDAPANSGNRFVTNNDFFQVSQMGDHRTNSNARRSLNAAPSTTRANVEAGANRDNLDIPMPVIPLQIQPPRIDNDAAGWNPMEGIKVIDSKEALIPVYKDVLSETQMAESAGWRAESNRSHELPMRMTVGPIRQVNFEAEADSELPRIINKRDIAKEKSRVPEAIRWRISD